MKPYTPHITNNTAFTSKVILFALLQGVLMAITILLSPRSNSSSFLADLKSKLTAQKTPIWVSDGISVVQLEQKDQGVNLEEYPSQNQVALFRGIFDADRVLQDAQLSIFADTRYEVWVDGKWIGRGPARFSTTLKEIDHYPLGQFQPGSHLIAVLVQWAPNNRRSESTRPMLIADIEAKTGLRTQKFFQTGPEWKAMLADAWRSDAAIVHAWGLIGPTELLDLRRLPTDWQQMVYSDQDWPQAILLDAVSDQTAEEEMELPIETYTSRSISNLVEYAMPFTIYETGLASPDCSMMEIFAKPASLSNNAKNSSAELSIAAPSYYLDLSAASSTSLKLETLSITNSVTFSVKVDGTPVGWQAVGKERLDVYQALISGKTSPLINQGPHQIEFAHIPADGATFCISNQNIKIIKDNPQPNTSLDIDIVSDRDQMRYGNNAGRRTSLAQLVPDDPQDSDHVFISSVILDPPASPGIDIQFQTPPGIPAYVILDAGRTIHGRLHATISGPSGSIVDIGWDERFRSSDPSITGARPYPYLGSLYPYWNQVDSWILDGEERLLTTLDARAGRYILIISWSGGPVQISDLQVLEERYPLDQIGEFHSSDPLLDRIWQVGIDTLRPNMTDALTDTPWRERGQWWGDVHADNRIAQTAFRDQTLLRRGLIFMADAMLKSPAPGMAPNNQGLHMLDYAMLWVQDLSTYLQITDDQSLAVQVFPSLSLLMEHLAQSENDRTGLLDLAEGHWSTTAYIDVTGNQNRFGQSTALNSLYSDTLKRAAWVATRVGDPEKANHWEQKSKGVKRTVNNRLYREKDHLYWTRQDSEGFYQPSVAAQSWALAYDMIPEDQRQAATDGLLVLISKDPTHPNIGTYGMLWALEALGKADRYQQAIELIRSYYGSMLQSGTNTWWESFLANEYAEISISHGWSGAPTWFLSTYVLGVRQITADEWQIQPSFAGVQRASGKLPLQSGVLIAEWEISSCGESWMQISSPLETTGEVILPSNWKDIRLFLDGKEIWSQNEQPPVQPASAGILDRITGRWLKPESSPNIHLDQQGLHILLPGGSYFLKASYQCNP